MSNVASAIGGQRAPVVERGLPGGPRRRVRPALQVPERHVVRRHQPGPGAGLDGHVADGQAPRHGQRADGRAAVLEHVALAAAGADLGDDGQDQVLGRYAIGQRAVHRDRHRLGPDLRQRLGGQHVLHLAGADAEGQRAERAVGRGMRVAAHDRQARLGQPELRADDVHDALVGVAHRVQPDAELRAVLPQRLDLGAGHRVGEWAARAVEGGWGGGRDAGTGDPGGRHVVVFGGDGQVGAPHLAAGRPQPVERLRAGHLVQQVKVDIEQVGLALRAAHHVGVPDFLGERTAHHALSLQVASRIPRRQYSVHEQL